MAARCEICGKGPSTGNSVSHSVRRTRRWWKPNLTSVRAQVGGAVRRVRICTSCLKAGKVRKVV